MTESSKYVTYFRVSTEKQGNSGLGLDAQMASVSQFVNSRGGVVLDSVTEVESGKRADRPQLSNALRKCSLTGAVLVIAKLDRLSRDIAFIANLQKSKVDFICCDMPDANTLTIGMMAVLAQYERELISERTKAGLKAAKIKGIKLGNPTLHLVRNTNTSRATAVRSQKAQTRNKQLLETILEIERGNNSTMTLDEIACALNETGCRTARGYEFTKTQVSRIKALQNITD